MAKQSKPQQPIYEEQNSPASSAGWNVILAVVFFGLAVLMLYLCFANPMQESILMQIKAITVGLGGKINGIPREDGFQITVGSEVMAILCLAKDLQDLKERLGKILVAYTFDNQPVTAADINAQGAMAVLLKEALKPGRRDSADDGDLGKLLAASAKKVLLQKLEFEPAGN